MENIRIVELENQVSQLKRELKETKESLRIYRSQNELTRTYTSNVNVRYPSMSIPAPEYNKIAKKQYYWS